jgi:hypothetical protein
MSNNLQSVHTDEIGIDSAVRDAFLDKFTKRSRRTIVHRIQEFLREKPVRQEIDNTILSQIKRFILSEIYEVLDDDGWKLLKVGEQDIHRFEILRDMTRIWRNDRKLFHDAVTYYNIIELHKTGTINLAFDYDYYRKVTSRDRWRRLRARKFDAQGGICAKCHQAPCTELHHLRTLISDEKQKPM